MTDEGLFAIDVAAEVATLCESQLQGPWQVPAELVRLAAARGASRVEVRRVRGGLEIVCDAVAATLEVLADVATALDRRADPRARQEAISRIEAGGAAALLWAAGARGSRVELRCSGPEGRWELDARRRRVHVAAAGDDHLGGPASTMRWRGSRRTRARAVAWLETALRFLPVPTSLDGRPMARGFPEGLVRMRIAQPLPAEIAVTASGDMPSLWLLQHGVLSARAVVPGYPAFSAAVEMSGVVTTPSSPAELRSAANPHLPALIDRAVAMLVQLGGRLSTVDEPARRRVAELLLRAAELGLERTAVIDLPMIPLRTAAGSRLASPAELAGLAAGRGGSVSSVDPGRTVPGAVRGPVAEVGAVERRLLEGLLGVAFEVCGAGRQRRHPMRRLAEAWRWLASRLRGVIGGRTLADCDLDAAERRAVEAAGRYGLDVGFAIGAQQLRRRAGRVVLGRGAPSVGPAVRAAAADDAWLYPALLAAGVGPEEIPEAVRTCWLELWTPGSPALEPHRRPV